MRQFKNVTIFVLGSERNLLEILDEIFLLIYFQLNIFDIKIMECKL